jgi:N-acetylglucosaminyl-diphospho-decaprenol L-rhamnosyltransferase
MPKVADPNAQVTIVTVSFNSLSVLPEMLSSIPAGTKVIVVDNASDDPTALRIVCESKGAVLLRNDHNVGFGRACNQGADAADSEFLFFLNPDATLMPDTILQLVNAARRYPRATAMNPRIASANGSAFFHRSTALMPKSDFMPRGWPSADKDVTVLTGAALFVRREDFVAVGGFDPKIFLYHEDDDLSLRLRQERGPIMFIHDAFVRHRGGDSTPRGPEVSALKAYHMARSAVYAMRKHGRPLPFIRALLKAIVGLFSLDMLWSKRRRAKNWAFIKGVFSTMRDGGAA